MNAGEAKEFYLKRPPPSGPAWAAPVREEARARFAALGFPTTHDEDWKYTSVEPVAKVSFAPGAGAENGVNDAIGALGLDGAAGNRLVFVDGRFSPRLSRFARLPGGVIVGSLAAAMEERREFVAPLWARLTDQSAQSFGALNTALAEDGAFVYVPAGAIVEEPIRLLFIAGRRDEPTNAQTRSLIALGHGSQATVIESYAAVEGEPYWTNAVT
jgi:Fe-S cluster assembly protein SufD